MNLSEIFRRQKNLCECAPRARDFLLLPKSQPGTKPGTILLNRLLIRLSVCYSFFMKRSRQPKKWDAAQKFLIGIDEAGRGPLAGNDSRDRIVAARGLRRFVARRRGGGARLRDLAR